MSGTKFYAEDHAVNFELARRENQTLCVVVEFAAKIPSKGVFDWDNRIRFNLLDSELMTITAMFLGYTRTFKLKNNGKWLDFECQSAESPHVFLKAGSGSSAFHAVPIAGGHVALASIKLLTLSQQVLGIAPEIALEALRSSFKPYPFGLESFSHVGNINSNKRS